MVVGLYGLGYGYAAWRLDRAGPFVAIGLAGKVLGPIGWAGAVISGEWPIRTFPLIAFNDIAWWLPFSLFLLEGTRVGERVRASAPFACAALNALAAAAMLFALRPGTEVVSDVAQRAAYIAEHPILWRGGWVLWMAAALSLLGFYAWWGARLLTPAWGLVAFAVAAAGLACDFLAESLFLGWLPMDLETITRIGVYLTGAAANGLYTLAGIILTLATSSLRGFVRVWTWAVWASGLSLTVSTIAGSVTGIFVSTAVLMALFCPWAAVMGWKLR